MEGGKRKVERGKWKEECKKTDISLRGVGLTCHKMLCYNAATLLSSFLMARLMKSLIVVPVVATKAATRE